MSKNERSQPKYVICVRNENYPASLELRKVYRAIPDAKASSHKMLRVVDESGEDYLYPSAYLAPVELPQAAESLFSEAS